jgi:hypothetical protein
MIHLELTLNAATPITSVKKALQGSPARTESRRDAVRLKIPARH